jgi:uncharacterized protein YjiS (DUF1127 family)
MATLKCWLMGSLTWRIEQAAISALLSMSNRALRHIGLTRSGTPQGWATRQFCRRAVDAYPCRLILRLGRVHYKFGVLLKGKGDENVLDNSHACGDLHWLEINGYLPAEF